MLFVGKVVFSDLNVCFVAEKGGIDFDAFVIGSNESYFSSNLAGGGHFWKWRNTYLNHVEGGCQPEIEIVEP